MANNYYKVKRLVSKLGLKSKKIDCSENGCMFLGENDSGKNCASLLECKFCDQPEYHTIHLRRRKKNYLSSCSTCQ